MGMSSDQNENVSFKEEVEAKKKEAEKKAAAAKTPTYTTMGKIVLNGKSYQLLIGEDKKWYKAEFVKTERIDEMNRTPEFDVYSNEITPLTEKEFNSYFNKK